MKILQLCKKFPFPLKDGESIAVTNLSKALKENGCDLVLLSMNTSKHYVDVDKLPSKFSQYSEIHTIDIDNHIKPLKAFLNLFSTKSYHVTRFESGAYAKKLIELLENADFDIVLLETAFLASYIDIIRKHSNASVIMRAHNVEHEIWERVAQNTTFVPFKWYLKHSAQKLKRFELKVLNSYDFLVPISEKDLSKYRKLGYANGAEAIPIGLDFSVYKPAPLHLEKPLSLSFIGSLDWLPNYEGLSWFVNKVFDEIRHTHPEIELHIAGRNRPDKVSQLSRDSVYILGEVDDAREFLNSCPIMIVPLRSGSGMRAKILEGLALGRVVITTSLGLEGINAEDKKHVLVADNANEFVEAITWCKADLQRMANLAENGRRFVLENYDHNRLARHFKSILSDYLMDKKEGKEDNYSSIIS